MSDATEPRLEYSPGPGLLTIVLRCGNALCTVETFKGNTTMPMNSCPNCVRTGMLL